MEVSRIPDEKTNSREAESTDSPAPRGENIVQHAQPMSKADHTNPELGQNILWSIKGQSAKEAF
jgi:hypothetical protein